MHTKYKNIYITHIQSININVINSEFGENLELLG